MPYLEEMSLPYDALETILTFDKGANRQVEVLGSGKELNRYLCPDLPLAPTLAFTLKLISFTSNVGGESMH